MTDQELLELAAKAASFKIETFYDGKVARRDIDGQPIYWNPLKDDGDAVRLAVKLGLDVLMHGCLTTFPYAVAFNCMRNIAEEEQPDDGDPFAATRRAIVRAAATHAKKNGRDTEMKLTPEQLAALKALKMPDWLARKDDPWAHEAARAIPALIADLEEAQRRISISEAFAKELSSELITTRKQLAEAQARANLAIGLADELRSAGGRDEYQKLTMRMQDLAASHTTEALDAAIAEAVEPYRKDAERYRYLRSNSTGPSAIWELMSDDAQPQYFMLKPEALLDAAIDAAIAAKGGENEQAI